MQAPARDRVASGAATLAMLGALGTALVWGLAAGRPVSVSREPTLLALAPREAPPPVRQRRMQQVRSRKAAAAPSPPNLRNKATPVASPPPIVPLAPPPPIVVAPRPAAGSAAASGASDRPGPGQGAGGQGNGTGGGGSGDGAGFTPPRQIKGRLRYSDMPPELRASGVGGSVGVRYRVETDGRVSACSVTTSSGNSQLDQLTCALIEERFRFRPSLDPEGRPVRSNIVETHSWIVDRSDYDAPPRP